jgi:hypothetical protein
VRLLELPGRKPSNKILQGAEAMRQRELIQFYSDWLQHPQQLQIRTSGLNEHVRCAGEVMARLFSEKDTRSTLEIGVAV